MNISPGTIKKMYIPQNKLVIFTVIGLSTFDQFMNIAVSFFEKKILKRVIWDFRHGAVGPFSSQQLDSLFLAKNTKKDLKCFIIAPENKTYQTEDNFRLLNKMKDLPVNVKVGRNVTFEERTWLFS